MGWMRGIRVGGGNGMRRMGEGGDGWAGGVVRRRRRRRRRRRGVLAIKSYNLQHTLGNNMWIHGDPDFWGGCRCVDPR